MATYNLLTNTTIVFFRGWVTWKRGHVWRSNEVKVSFMCHHVIRIICVYTAPNKRNGCVAYTSFFLSLYNSHLSRSRSISNPRNIHPSLGHSRIGIGRNPAILPVPYPNNRHPILFSRHLYQSIPLPPGHLAAWQASEELKTTIPVLSLVCTYMACLCWGLLAMCVCVCVCVCVFVCVCVCVCVCVWPS